MLNPFVDNRPIPNIKVNFKVKIKTKSAEETASWNRFFAYIMKKPRTKIEFSTISLFRELPITNIKIENIENFINKEDYDQLFIIKDIFENRLPIDLKAFILSMLQVPIKAIKQ